MDEEEEEDEEYPNKETEKLFEGVENGDEEVVKVLLLGNKNKQFELDINFQFYYKKVFFFKLNFSLSLSLSCCSDVMECEWLCCVDIWFCFYSFFNNFKGWKDRSSHSCWERFWTNCENSCWTWIQSWSSRFSSLDFLFLFVVVGSLLVCFMLIVNGCVVWYLILFLFFFLNNFLFVKGGRDRSSHCYVEWFWTNCENSCWTWIQCWSSRSSFDFLFFWFSFFISLFFSHFLICCCGFIVGLFHVDSEELCCDIWFCFYSFFNNFLFVKVWNDRSSLCC